MVAMELRVGDRVEWDLVFDEGTRTAVRYGKVMKVGESSVKIRRDLPDGVFHAFPGMIELPVWKVRKVEA